MWPSEGFSAPLQTFSLDSFPDMWRKGNISPTCHFTLLMIGKRSDLTQDWNASDFCRFVTHGSNVLTPGDQISTKYEFFIWIQIVVHKSVRKSINCPPAGRASFLQACDGFPRSIPVADMGETDAVAALFSGSNSLNFICVSRDSAGCIFKCLCCSCS